MRRVCAAEDSLEIYLRRFGSLLWVLSVPGVPGEPAQKPGRSGLWMEHWCLGVTVLSVFAEEAARAGHRAGILHRPASDAAHPAGWLQPRQGRGSRDLMGSRCVGGRDPS